MNVGEDYMEANELPDDLMSIRRINTYKVPVQYFDELADDIMSQVNLPLAPVLPLSVPPANYFDNLASAVFIENKKTDIHKTRYKKN